MCNFNKGYLFLVLGLLVPAIILVIACGPSAPASTEPAGGSAAVSESVSNGTAQESVVAVNFSGKQLTPETIQVKQDENVTLNLETDRPGSFHIHGYDLEKEAAVGEVTEFQFVANATGRFRITFHGAASPEPAMTGTEGMKGETPMAGMDRTSGEHDMSSVSGGSAASGSMDHGPVESAAPVSVDISATVVDRGVHVKIDTEGWRWAPGEVNSANSDGAGHANIYADGVKLSRVYGPYHYLPSLEPGAHELRASLNDNGHNELTWQGRPLEAITTVIMPEAAAMSAHDSGALGDTVDSEAFMGVNIVAQEDALGGYNLQVEPMGFRFAQAVGESPEPGEGYAVFSINGEVFNRLYVPRLQVPAQGEGMHTFTVALINNEGKPYSYNGQPVEASIQVHEVGKTEDSASAEADHHGSSSTTQTSKDHDSDTGSQGGGHHGDGSSGEAAAPVELEVGYLEVWP